MAETYSIEAILSARDQNFTSTMQKALSTTQSLGSKLKQGIGFGTFMAIGQKAVNVVSGGIRSLASNTGDAVKRLDTLNNFPKVMKNLGYNAKEAKKTIEYLSESTDGLPTSLDAIVSSTQKMIPMTGNMKKAANVSLALNDALLAGGKSAEEQANALEQYSQMLAAGKVDMQAWRSMQSAMGGQLDTVAQKLLGAKNKNVDLYEAMKAGKVTFDDFNEALIDLDKKGLTVGGKKIESFKKQAQTMTGGIVTSMNRIKTATTKNLAKMIEAVDAQLKAGGFGGIAENFDKVREAMDSTFKKVTGSKTFKTAVDLMAKAGARLAKTGPKIADAFGSIGDAIVRLANDSATKDLFNGLISAFEKLMDVISKNADFIVNAGAAFLIFKTVGGVAGRIKGIADAFGSLKGALGGGASKAMENVGDATKAAGDKVGTSATNFLKGAAALVLIGTAVLITAAGFWVLAQAATTLAAAGAPAIATFFGMVVAMGALMAVMAYIAKTITVTPQAAAGMLLLSVSVVALSAGMYILAAAAVMLAGAGTNAIAALGVMGTIMVALVAVIGAFGASLAIGAAGLAVLVLALAVLATQSEGIAMVINALGDTISKVFTAAAPIVAMVCVTIISGLQQVNAIVQTVGQVVTAIFTGVQGVITTFGTTVTSILTAIGSAFTAFGESVNTIMQGVADVITAVGDSISGVLDSVAGIFDSIGNAALNAGKGVKEMAAGIKMLVSLKLGDLTATLVATASGLKKIGNASKGLKGAGSSIKALGAGLRLVASGSKIAGAGILILITSMSKIKAAVNGAKASLNGITSAFTKAAGSAKTSGSRMGQGFTTGLKSSINHAKSIAVNVSSGIMNTLKSGVRKARYVGAQIGAGVASGLSSARASVIAECNRMIARIDEVLRKKAQIHSPSKMTKKIGKFLAEGLGVGMRDGIVKVKATAKKLIGSVNTTLKAEVKKGTWSKAYGDAADAAASRIKEALEGRASASISRFQTVSSKLMDKLYKKMEKSTVKLNKGYKSNKSGKNNKKYNATVKKYNKKQRAENEKYNKWVKQHNKNLQASYDVLEKKINKRYENAVEKSTQKVINKAETKLNKLRDTYQAAYDKIVSAKETFISNMQSYGDMATLVKGEDAVAAVYDKYGFLVKEAKAATADRVELFDFKAATADIKRMQTQMKTLQKWGASQSFIDQFGSMDNEKRKLTLDQLMSLGKNGAQAYMQSFNTYMNAAESIGADMYAPYVNKLNESYKAEVSKVMSSLKTELTTVGKNAAKGLIAGIKDKSMKKALKSAAGSLANSVIKTIKKKLKIASPSKVMAKLGTFTGEGFAQGLEEVKRDVANAMNEIVAIPQQLSPAFAGNMGMSEDYNYGAHFEGEFIVPVDLDGKKIAEVSAPFTEEILNKRQRRENRKVGRV